MAAEVAEQATPLAMWQRNLDLVTNALDGAGIDYFCVRHKNDLQSAVAVPLARKGEALRALQQLTQQPQVTVRLTNGAGKRATPKQRAAVVQVFSSVSDPDSVTVLGSEFACEVEFWHVTTPDDRPITEIVAPRGNQVASSLPAQGQTVAVPTSRLTRLAPERGEPGRYRSRAEFAGLGYEHITFPIDAVYTWVDGNDTDWMQRKNLALLEQQPGSEISDVAANASRYVSRDELRYSLRSLVAFLPWIRMIYLVTDDQVPPWLDVAHPMIKVVPHRDIFGGTGRLPSFNSHAIESRLHRIAGLSEHFIYINDDMFFGRPLLPTKFFHANGLAKFFPSPAQLDVGPATIHDAPVTAAGKNNRRHIQERFGRTITQKMRHVPYPLRKSVLEDIERELTDEVLATAQHQFRHPGDLSIPSSLQHYWSYLSGKAAPGSIAYSYADLGHPSAPIQLARLLTRRDRDAFCLNDTDSAEVSLPQQHAMLSEFLSAYFPFRAPFELPAHLEAERSSQTATALAAASLPLEHSTDLIRQGSGNSQASIFSSGREPVQ
ncbi:stealth family protein [Micromonospora andamanensis]|uniref:Exopolysaccharide phosphotransferase n=1 Tax=Micromonospora andamanensis TaxID=1287068 RepID=A0ABQ4I120_9ACTN|nr:stealth family protein [Micromonospora andamanensis]GIJ11566.1 exopolysaccharide phosphotransferase [Micromonospora andamanensis]GIJ39884.1 exopolysaccharide phosphotransferase [Micromonospora andamanensis]